MGPVVIKKTMVFRLCHRVMLPGGQRGGMEESRAQVENGDFGGRCGGTQTRAKLEVSCIPQTL